MINENKQHLDYRLNMQKIGIPQFWLHANINSMTRQYHIHSPLLDGIYQFQKIIFNGFDYSKPYTHT